MNVLTRRLPRLRAAVRRQGFVVLAGVAVLLAAGSVTAGRQDWKATGLASFDMVWQTVNDTYYDPAFGGLDWAAIRAELRPRAAAAETPDAIRDVIREMLTRIRQSHFALLASTAAPDMLPGPANVPIDIRVAAEGVLVTRVEAESSAYHEGVRAGDLVAGIDGNDVAAWIATEQGRDERQRRLQVWQRAFRALHGEPDSTARLTLRDLAGQTKTIDATRTLDPGQTVTLGNLPPMQVKTAVTEAHTPAGRTAGVIAFNAWMTTVAQPFANAVDKYRQSAGIVVDLRGNPGGLADMIRGISGHFLTTPDLVGRVQMRDVVLEFRANPRRSTVDGRRVDPFGGSFAILVDDLTASASECFAGGLQSLGRARVFGTRTMGQALPASTRQLPNDDVLLYALGDFVTSTGRRLEGEGVVPDQEVPLSRQALAAGRDLALEAALNWIDRASVSR